MDIAVNGTVVSAGLAFASTGTWDTWSTVTLSIPVSAGTNAVRATATTANGGPNVDAITVVTTG
jgi:exo-1,4-beta-D-glucosaminidase